MEVRRSETFDRWLRRLRDPRVVARIMVRIDRLIAGNAGDVKSVGQGVLELRIDYGPGYRVYYVQRGHTFVVLLCGGDKSSQASDIERAHVLARQWRNDARDT